MCGHLLMKFSALFLGAFVVGEFSDELLSEDVFLLQIMQILEALV